MNNQQTIINNFELLFKKLDSIEQRSVKLDQRLEKLEQRLEKLEQSSVNIIQSSAKMSNHIDFVESIYERIKAPFHYVLDKVSEARFTNDSLSINDVIPTVL